MTRSYDPNNKLDLQKRLGRLNSEIWFILARYDCGALPQGVPEVIGRLERKRDVVAALIASASTVTGGSDAQPALRRTPTKAEPPGAD